MLQAPIDFKHIPPLAQLKTVTAVNSFVLSTSSFLNKFSFLCESKLEQVHKHLQRLEITLNILEAKLSSIPGLEGSAAPSSQPTTQQPTDSINNQQQSMQDTIRSDTPQEAPAAGSTDPVPSVANPIKNDPAYAQFFKMLRLGVPPPLIKKKMEDAGLNPDLLDDPERPAPAAGGFSTTTSSSKALQENSSEDENDDNASQAQPPPPPPMMGGPPLPPPPSASNHQDSDDDEDEDDDD